MIKINNIFTSIQGEGEFQGFPTLFLRLFGCNLKCLYCDALEAVEGNHFSNISIDEVAKKIANFSGKHICITGGEPLVQKNNLLKLLQKIDISKTVSIETNGSLFVGDISKMFPNVVFSVDWKTPASGKDSFLLKNLDVLKNKNGWIKFVVSNEEDFSFIKDRLEFLKKNRISIFVSPVFEQGKKWFLKTEKFCLKQNLRFQLQIHKILGVE